MTAHPLCLVWPLSLELPFVDYQYPARKGAAGLLALVGEAPGRDEVRLGRPFVGRSGQLLDKNLLAAGLAREECLVANVFRYQPPDNKIGHFFVSRKMASETGEPLLTDWGKYASRFCRARFGGELDHLAKTLRALRPKVIVTLGATPLWALTGLEGIVARRGAPAPCRFLEDVPVIPAFHPSYILRGNWAAEPLLAKDLMAAREVLESNC